MDGHYQVHYLPHFTVDNKYEILCRLSGKSLDYARRVSIAELAQKIKVAGNSRL